MDAVVVISGFSKRIEKVGVLQGVRLCIFLCAVLFVKDVF